MIRPDGPLPETRARSTPSSRASLRTAGPAGLIVSLGEALFVASPFATATAADALAAGAGTGCSTTAGSLGFTVGVGGSGSAGFSTGGAAAGCAAEPPSESNACPTFTVSPFLTSTSCITPPGGQGTSITALSVSTSSTD